MFFLKNENKKQIELSHIVAEKFFGNKKFAHSNLGKTQEFFLVSIYLLKELENYNIFLTIATDIKTALHICIQKKVGKNEKYMVNACCPKKNAGKKAFLYEGDWESAVG